MIKPAATIHVTNIELLRKPFSRSRTALAGNACCSFASWVADCSTASAPPAGTGSAPQPVTAVPARSANTRNIRVKYAVICKTPAEPKELPSSEPAPAGSPESLPSCEILHKLFLDFISRIAPDSGGRVNTPEKRKGRDAVEPIGPWANEGLV